MPAKKQEVKDEAKKTSTNKAKKVTSENEKKVVQKGTSPKAKQTATENAEERKEEAKKIETRKIETKKAETKKLETKKAETKKTETRKKETTETVATNATVANKKIVKVKKTSEKPLVENKKVKKTESSGLAKQIIEEGKELAKRMTIEDNKKNTKDKLKEEKKEDINIKKIGKHSKEIKAREDVEIEEVVAKEIKKNKKIPKEALNKIYTRVFNNIFLAIAVILYLDFVILGFMNIDHNVLMTDLKVFGIMLLVISIYNIEKAYKNESKSYVISAIEFAVLAISTIMIIYINVIMPSKIVPIIVLLAFAFAIYYTIKATVIYLKSKKKYYMETMKEIIKK